MCKRLIYLISFVLALVAVPLVTNAQVENLVQNPSFEEDEAILDDPDELAWWTWYPAEGAGSSATIVDTDFIDGARSLMIEPQGGADWYFMLLQDGLSLEVGREYTTSFWAKAAAPRPLTVQMKASDNSVSWGWTQFQLTTDWAEYSLSAPAENAAAKLEFHCAETEDTIWLDLVSLYAEVVLPPSLLINGSFEEDELILDDPDWAQWCTWNPPEGAGSNAMIVDTESIDGTRSLRVEPIGSVDWYFIVSNISFPLEVGADFTITFWAKAEAPRPLGVSFKAEDNSVSWGWTGFQLTTEWAEYTTTSPAESAEGKIEFSCAGVEVPFWLDFVSVYAEAGPGPDEPDEPDAPVGNLMQNPSFEEDEAILDDPDELAWWTWYPAEGAGSNVTIVDTEALDGARSLMIEPLGGTDWYFIVINSPIPLEVGTSYVTSFWAKAAAPRPLSVAMKATDNSVTWGWTQFDLTTDWVEYSLSAPAENATAKLEFQCAATNDTIWLDLVSVDEEALLSPSVLLNGSFEEDEVIQDEPEPWVAWATWNDPGGSGTVTFDQTEVIHGDWSLKIEPQGGTDWFFIVLQADIPLDVGREYTTNFWAKAATPRPFGVGLKAMDNSITWSGATFDLTTDWAEYSVSGVAMNELAKMEFYCAATNDTIWLDNVSLRGGEPAPALLVANGSFEEDEEILDDPAEQAWWTWYPAEGAGSNATIVDTEFTDGARSLMIEPRGGTDWYFIVINSPIPLDVGTTYVTSFWAKAAVPRPLTVQMKATDNSVSWGWTQFQLTTDWAEYSISAPAENATAKLEFQCAATNDTLWLDLVSVDEEEGLVVNGSFEDALGPEWWTWGWEAGLGSTYEIDPSTAVDGTNSLRVDPVGGGENWYFMVINSPIPLEVGTTYTASFWAKAEEPRSIGAKLKAEDNSVEWSETQFQLTTEWAEYSFTAEALNASAKFEIHCGNAITAWLDFVNIYEGEYDPGLAPAGSVNARGPNPADGAIDVSRDATLSWISGNAAVMHDVYFGTNVNDVDNADITDATSIYRGSQDRGATSYTPTESPLEWGQTYYWRIDEANDADPNSPLKGNVWSFTVINHVVVDDFESYNDITAGEEGSNLVYSTWIDGYENPLVNGATIGYVEAFQPSMETAIVHGGGQSVPLIYDNSTAGLSEVTRTLNADWTQDGVLTLTVFYKGSLTNADEPMYVALNGTVITHDNPKAARAGGWTQWDILLQDFADLGVNLANVNTMSIGFGNKANPVSGGSGYVFIDDIRLYRSLPVEQEPEVEPVDPGAANLVASYSFENNTQDGSGNGLNGVIMGNPFFVEGIAGMALTFDGVNDYVNLGNSAAFDITEQITLSAWVNTNDTGNGQHNPYVGKGDNAYAIKHASSNTIEFFIYDAGWHQAQVSVDSSFNGEWHHVGGTYDGSELKTYVDGILGATVAHAGLIEVQIHNLTIGNNSQESGRFYDGAIDEVKIYNRALSKAEIRFLVGN